MTPLLNHRSLWALDSVSPADVQALLATGRSLRDAEQASLAQTPLRGKNIALLCEDQDGTEATLFRNAATALGAHVARVRPSLAKLHTDIEVQHTARMLGRLYDAIECQGMAPQLVRDIARDAGVPVYDGLGSAGHPMHQLAGMLDGDASAADKQRILLQALLVSTIA
ncbi:MAG TPA: ornithine carbamoyltransferase [Albitalea sp.]|nr:ornithine carbamoyltransferase [Albitalea sp.]